MKFFLNRSLKQLAVSILAGMFLIFFTEYLIIRHKIEVLEEIEASRDYARSAQLEDQQIAFLLQLHLNGNGQSDLVPQITSRLQNQEHRLLTLGNGGRVDQADILLEPLSGLPKTSYEVLLKNWTRYKEDIIFLLSPEIESEDWLNEYSNADSLTIESNLPNSLTSTDTVANIQDSTITEKKTLTPALQRAQIRTLLSGQWLTLTDWYNNLLKDLTAKAEEKKFSLEIWSFLFNVIDLLVIAGLFYLFYRFVLLPIKKQRIKTAQLEQESNVPQNEIGALTAEINKIIEQLKDATEFVFAIGEGKLDFDYKTLDSQYTSGKNKLADSLISMQGKLKVLNEEEQRRQWANEGLTKFVDILRSSNDDIAMLSDKIISALVHYTNSNQGALYILNDEDERNKYLELISLFAFDIKKYEKQKLKLGEGILGQTFLEKETTVLTEIPDEYVRITSGLGGSNPKSLLIVPLKVDKDVYGIVELASFKEYRQYEIAFVEKLAETIASTLASVKAAQKNKDLIEQFGVQTEQMRAQEEEMRQNVEELVATQEEMGRKEKDYVARIQQLEQQYSKSITHQHEHDKLKEEFAHKTQKFRDTIQELEQKLSMKPVQSDDWALAEELEKTLKIQLEALKITNDEITKNQKQ
jgi:putative methionine-R-sulfoxide reductase with GAF domain